MINQDVCSYIQDKINAHYNQKGNEYFADFLVKKGYGQNYGGYFDDFQDLLNTSLAEPNQKLHFINYYMNGNRKDQKPSYASLHCPQLMLWIAEIAGLNDRHLNIAYDFIVTFEEENKLKQSQKGGNYLKDYEGVEEEFKKLLKIYDINTIIKNSNSWKEVLSEVNKL